MEIGKTSSIFNKPKNNYTKKLINSEPKSKLLSQNQASKTILDVSELEVDYEIRKKFLWKPKKTFKAVNKVNFKLLEGETLGIVGESGSGKSSLAQALLKLIASQGQIKFFDDLISNFKQNKFRKIRRHIQIIFQDPFASLSPRMTVENIIGEGLNVHKIAESKKKKLLLIKNTLKEVGLESDMLHRYPHEFSGGQRQRIAIARALILKPNLVILDEPTSALDMTIQSQIIDLLLSLQMKHKLSYIFISHDLKIIRAISDKIIVMKDGKIIESGSKSSIFNNPSKKYTKDLINSAFF